MKRLITISALLLMFWSVSFAQQDAMFTKYMFNTLSYNPAYAGSHGYLSMGALHRTQWWGIQGAPHTQVIWAHMPVKSDKIGIGFTLSNDIIGPTSALGANLSYAYHIPLGDNSKWNHKLGIGIQGGVTFWRADWNKLTREQQNDMAFLEENPKEWLPNFGAGLYYHSDYVFAGVGIPKILENELRKVDDSEVISFGAQEYRHYYFSAGGAIPLDGGTAQSSRFVLRPMVLFKSVGLLSALKKEDNPTNNVGAPTEFDIDVSLFMFQTLWVGTSFRSSIEKFAGNKSSFDSVDIWAAYYFANGLRLGVAYDYSLTKIQQPAQGSFEVMLGYDFNFEEKSIVTPRYF